MASLLYKNSKTVFLFNPNSSTELQQAISWAHFYFNIIYMTLIKSHPILVVLLSSVSTSTARLLLSLLTPCKKRDIRRHNSHKCGQTRAVHIQRQQALSGIVWKFTDMIAHDRTDLRTGTRTAD